MTSREDITRSSAETLQWGRELGVHLSPPVLLLLYGELGAGKTTLAKGLVSGLGAAREEEVTSPTFTLVHVYRNSIRVYHVDLYRVKDSRDLETLGLEDLFLEPAVVIVEWPEKFALRADWPIVQIFLEYQDENARRIRVEDPQNALKNFATWGT